MYFSFDCFGQGKQLKKAIGNIMYIEGNCFEAVVTTITSYFKL